MLGIVISPKVNRTPVLPRSDHGSDRSAIGGFLSPDVKERVIMGEVYESDIVI